MKSVTALISPKRDNAPENDEGEAVVNAQPDEASAGFEPTGGVVPVAASGVTGPSSDWVMPGG